MTDYPEKTNTGKESCYIRLLTANYVRIKSFIFSMLPNESDADDVMQEASIIMWEKFDSFDPDTDFVAWAVTIAKFKVLEFRRKNFSNRVLLDNQVLDLLAKENLNFFDQTEERTEALMDCVQKLPEKDQDFLKLKYSHGLTLKKLAASLGLSVTSTFRNSSRIHGILQGCIQRKLKLRTCNE